MGAAPEQLQNKSARRWNFKPVGESLAIEGLSVIGAAAITLPFAVIMGPFTVAVFAGVSLYRTWCDAGKISEKDIPGIMPEHTALPSSHQSMRHVASLTKEFNLKSAPRVMQPPDMVAMNYPHMHEYYPASKVAALTTANIISLPRQAVDAYNPEELRFIIAHEMSHIKVNDSNRIHTHAKIYAIRFSLMAGIGMLANVALHMAGYATLAPLAPAAGTGMLVLAGAFFSFNAGIWLMNSAIRQAEYRADRNALYAAPNLDAAIAGLKKVYRYATPLMISQYMQPRPVIQEMQHTHPSFPNRIAALRSAWEDVRKARNLPSPAQAPLPPPDFAP